MTTSPQEHLQSALDDLTDALEAHLAASLARSSEGDPSVQVAYTALRQAAERYDNLLFDLADEVTPWEFPEAPNVEVEYEDEEALPTAVGVFVRRDYNLVDDAALVEAGREAYHDLYPEHPPETVAADVKHAGRAIFEMLHAYGVDGLEQRADDAGLQTRGGTVWVQALTDDDAATLADDPFGVADEDMLVYRLDEVIESNPLIDGDS